MINTEDIKYLERLIKLELTEEKREQYAKEIDSILEYIKEINEIELSENKGDTEYSHNNIFKGDDVIESVGHTEKAIQNAPEKLGNLYKVSQVIKQ